MICLNVRCVPDIVNCGKFLFTLGKLRNYVSLSAAMPIEVAFIVTTELLNVNKRSTTMKQILRSYSADKTYSNFKDFCLMNYDIVGFDLDGTLLRYELNNMVRLVHKLLNTYLVNEKNYPAELLNAKFECDLLQKGLIIDADRGNILKLGADGTILKAAHGTQFMCVNEICQVYGESRKWDIAQQYINDPLSAWNGPIADKLRSLLDYFDIGASLVFAQAVDALDKRTSNEYTLKKNDYKVWSDILCGLIKIYSRENFATGESAYFEALKSNPHKYLLKTNEKVIELLKELRAANKALYLLTGSNIDFVNLTASYSLGPKWQELFDYIIVFAKKPGFFFAQRKFLKIFNLSEIAGSEISLKENLLPNNCYSQGNWTQLKQSVCKYILHKDPQNVKSLYVGDNLIQDIYAPNAVVSIDTLALSEEILENDNNYEFKSIVQSPPWGSYFGDDGKPTLWAAIIERYSKLCVPHIDILAQEAATKK